MLIAVIEDLDWHLGLQVLAIIRIKGMAAIGNIISIALNGLMFGTIESGRIIGTDRHSGAAATRCCTVVRCKSELSFD